MTTFTFLFLFFESAYVDVSYVSKLGWTRSQSTINMFHTLVVEVTGTEMVLNI